MDFKQATCAIMRGMYDSFRGVIVVINMDREIREQSRCQTSPSRSVTPIRRRRSEAVTSEKETTKPENPEDSPSVMNRLLNCCFLNGFVYLLNCVVFEYVILPGVREVDSPWVEPVFYAAYSTLWVIPLFIISRIINCLWFQDIANMAFKHSGGRPAMILSLSRFLADIIFSVVIQMFFLVQAVFVSYVPYFGSSASFIHMCLLYSLYAFEYKWCNMGWELHKRVKYIENNWPYFLGFGIPLTALTDLPQNWIIRGCIFSVLFPVFIISGNAATPVEGYYIHPLEVFKIVIQFSNTMFSKMFGRTTARSRVAIPPRR